MDETRHTAQRGTDHIGRAIRYLSPPLSAWHAIRRSDHRSYRPWMPTYDVIINTRAQMRRRSQMWTHHEVCSNSPIIICQPETVAVLQWRPVRLVSYLFLLFYAR